MKNYLIMVRAPRILPHDQRSPARGPIIDVYYVYQVCTNFRFTKLVHIFPMYFNDLTSPVLCVPTNLYTHNISLLIY